PAGQPRQLHRRREPEHREPRADPRRHTRREALTQKEDHIPDVSGAHLRVPADLQTAGTYLTGIATQIEGELVALKNLLTPLQSTWTGVAQSNYQGLQAEWDIAADGLLGPTGILGMIAQSLNLNWNNYTDCEWSNTQTWKG